MMLPATVTQQRGVPSSFYCMVIQSAPRTERALSMSNRSKKRLRPARFGKCLGLSLTKKWHVPVIVPVSDSLKVARAHLILPAVFVVLCVAFGSALCACIYLGAPPHSYV